MEYNIKLLYETKKLLLIRYSSFASEIASTNFEYRTDLKYHTAATDGKKVYFDPNYIESLKEDERVFLMAHELMHIKFKHPFRLLDKNGKKKDIDIWNEVCDAIINANLERDGFKIKEGYMNWGQWVFKYSAEELYEMKLQEKENNKDNKANENQESENNDFKDDHSLWEEAFEKDQNDKEQKGNNNYSDINENEEFTRNRKERLEKARKNIEQRKEELLRYFNNDENNEIKLGSVGDSNNSISWETLLKREIEKEETIWSNRRSIAENNYAYRLEDIDIEDEAETEVMIDISGSVDLDLVKSFLRTLKPLLKNSKLKVGCFNEKFWGLTEIKTNNDIDNFTIPSNARGYYARTEDWDLAVRSFTKKNEVNKIIFTDGYPAPGNMPKEDLKGINVIWLVYGNKNFKPCCGKVINLTTKDLERLESNLISKGKSK